MSFNKLDKKLLPDLVVSVPTYNRCRLLDAFLEAHTALFARYNVPLHIYDNASTDDTEQVVQQWIKAYPFISYIRQPANVGPVQNVWDAINLPDARYVWPIGDGNQISEECLKIAIMQISLDVDAIVFNLPSSKFGLMNNTCNEGVLDNADVVLVNLKDVLSCLAVTVFSTRVIKSFDFSLYGQTYYPQTCCLLDYCAKNNFKLYWCQTVSIQGLAAASTLKRNWSTTSSAIEIGAVNWVQSINMLPYDETIKRLASVNTWFFNWRFLVVMRSHGAISLGLVIKNFSYILKAAPKNVHTVPFLFFCCLIPQPIVRWTINGFRVIKTFIGRS